MGRAAILLLIAALLAAGCSAESGSDEDGRALSTAEVRGPTTTIATSTTLAPVDCGTAAAELPDEAREVSEALGDFDGNGSTDQLFAYADRGSDPWHLRVALAGGGDVELELESVSGSERVQAVGGVDLDGEKGDEALAVVGSGASVTLVGVFRVAECELVQARAENGDPAALFVGGSVREGVGVSCREARVVQLKAESSDGRRYTTSQTILRLEGDTLRVTDTAPGPALVRGVDDEELERYYGFDCGTLGLGPG